MENFDKVYKSKNWEKKKFKNKTLVQRYICLQSKEIIEKHVVKLRATLNGPRSKNQCIQAILLVESFKLVPRPFDKGPKPESGKLRLIWHLFWRENQLVGTKRQC